MRRLLSVLIIIALLTSSCLADTLVMPLDLKKIDEEAFAGSTSLDEVVLPEGLESIDSRAFADSSLNLINFPASLESIAEDAFDNTPNLHISAIPGTDAYQWAADHNYLLGFTDRYDITVNMAIFEPDDEIGLYEDSFVVYFGLVGAYGLNGEPEWNIIQLSGPESNYELAVHNPLEATLTVGMQSVPATMEYEVSCEWDNRQVQAHVTVNFDYPDSLPQGTDIPDEICLIPNIDNVIHCAFVPDDYTFGNMDRVGLENYSGSADWWFEEHDLHIVPHSEGVFTGQIMLYAGNMYIRKDVTFRVEGAELQVEATWKDCYTITWALVEGVEEYTIKAYTDRECENLFRTMTSSESPVYFETDVGTRYWFVLEYGEDHRSAPVTVDPPDILPAPENLEASLDEEGTVHMSWSAVEGATGYRIYFSDESVWTVDTEWFSYEGEPGNDEMHLDEGQTIFVWVCADNGDGPNERAFIRITRSPTLETISDFVDQWEIPDTLYIDGDSITEISTENVTDPDELAVIESFNASLPELRTAINQYNLTVDGLYTKADSLASALGAGTLDAFSVDTEGFTFIGGEDALDLLAGGYHFVSVEDGDSDSVRIEVSGPGGTRYLGAGENGIWTASGLRGLRNGSSDELDWHTIINEKIDRIQKVIDLFDYAGAANEMVKIILELLNSIKKLSKYNLEDWIKNYLERFQSIERLDRFYSGFGILMDLYDIKLNIIKCQNLYYQVQDIDGLREHGHPTEMEQNDPIMTLRANELDRLIHRGIMMGVIDVCATAADVIWTLCPLAGKTKKLFTSFQAIQAEGFISDRARKLINAPKNLLSNFIDEAFGETYKDLKDTDKSLHYDFFGVVRDEEGNVLSGVKVTCGYNTVYTGQYGQYAMESPEEAARPTFSLDGYHDDSSRVILMKPFERSQEDVVMIAQRGYISGRVYDEDTNEPIEGASVKFGGKEVHSDAEGRYSMTARVYTEDRLTVTKQGYAPCKYAIKIEEEGQVIERDAPMKPIGPYTMSGTVYGEVLVHIYQNNEHPIWQYEPLPGVTVTCGERTTVTNVDGEFTIEADGPTATLHFSMDESYDTVDIEVRNIFENIIKADCNATLYLKKGTFQLSPHVEHYKETRSYVQYPSYYIKEYGWSYQVTIGDYEMNVPHDGWLYTLPVGVYPVSVRAKGLGMVFDEITIEEGQRAEWDVELPWISGVCITVMDGDGKLMTDGSAYRTSDFYPETNTYTDGKAHMYIWNPYQEGTTRFLVYGNKCIGNYTSYVDMSAEGGIQSVSVKLPWDKKD